MERIEECRALARAVNSTLLSIDAERQRAPESPLVYRSIALQYQALSARLAREKSGTRRLAEATVEYEKLVRDASLAARQFADVLDSKDGARIEAARGAATRLVKREGPLVTRIEGICHGK
jgi:capsule polysaccharide export protein KpsE/RkpR